MTDQPSLPLPGVQPTEPARPTIHDRSQLDLAQWLRSQKRETGTKTGTTDSGDNGSAKANLLKWRREWDSNPRHTDKVCNGLANRCERQLRY